MSTEIVQLNVIITALTTIFGAFGNMFIIYVFWKMKSLRTVNNVLLLQLAVVDLTKVLMILPVKAYTQLHAVDNYFDLGFYCPVSGFVETVTFVLSALLLAAIAIVRYYKVVRTRKYDKNFTKRRIVYYCIGMNAATLVLAILPLVGVGYYKYSIHHGVCFTTWSTKNLIFRTMFYGYTIGVCYPVLVYCYTKIFMKLSKHKNTVTANMNKEGQKRAEPRKQLDTKLKVMEACLEDVSTHSARDDKSRVSSQHERTSPALQDDQETMPPKDDTSMQPPQKDDTLTPSTTTSPAREAGSKLPIPLLIHPPIISPQEDGDSRQKEISATFTSERDETSNGASLDEISSPKQGRKSKARSAASKIRRLRLVRKTRQNNNYRNEIRVTKVMFTVVVAYSLCWLPAFFINILQLTHAVYISDDVLFLIITLVELKVFINPLIYGVWNHQFRKALKTMLYKNIILDTSVKTQDPVKTT